MNNTTITDTDTDPLFIVTFTHHDESTHFMVERSKAEKLTEIAQQVKWLMNEAQNAHPLSPKMILDALQADLNPESEG